MRRPLALLTVAIIAGALALPTPAIARKKPDPTAPCEGSSQYQKLGLAGRHEDVTPPIVPAHPDLPPTAEGFAASYVYRLDLSGSADVPNASLANVRVRLTWDNLSDFDMYVYDSAGNKLGESFDTNATTASIETVWADWQAHCTDLEVYIVALAGLPPPSNMDLDVTVSPVTPTAGTKAPKRCDRDTAVKPSELVPQPTVTGPIGDEGIRTGEPYAATLAPLPPGWVEEEFFFSGTARDVLGDGSEADYKQRILVRRPTDRAEFNGTMVFNWNNVTIPHDGTSYEWPSVYDTVYERGFAFVNVSVQYLGTEASPLGLKQYDPVRYGTLHNPGSPGTADVGDTEYSFDIFSQAAEAAITPRVMGELLPCVQRRLVMGHSQSGDRLKHYINRVHDQALVFDGFQPLGTPGGPPPRRGLVPILAVNSQAEATQGLLNVPPDSGLFRLWELPGLAHTNHQYTTYNSAVLTYAQSNGLAGTWDPQESGAWGYQAAPGECLADNYYPSSYAWSAAMVALDDWVRTGVPPEPQPRAARDPSGEPIYQYDDYGNVLGGVRSPIIDVPIATYYVTGLLDPSEAPPGPVPGTRSLDPCGVVGTSFPLHGSTRVFDGETLRGLYPTPEDYLEKFDAAVERALAAGTLLPEGAEDLRRRALDAAAFIADATS